MAIKSFNSVGGFSVGETPDTIILPNGDIWTDNGLFTGNVTAQTALKVDSLLHLNGDPWDFEQPAGTTGQLQYNENNDFGASANLTYDDSTQLLSVNGTVDTTLVQTTDLDATGNVVADKLVADVDLTSPSIVTSTITSNSTNADLVLDPNGDGVVVIADDSGGAVGIELGSPSLGSLESNAVTLTTSSSVSNAIAQLNQILGKLVPPSPSDFPAGQTLSVSGLSTYRMTDYVQQDNTATGSRSVAAGTTVSTVLRTSTYSTNTISNAGPGDNGTVSVVLNGATAGSKTLDATLNANGTYGNLVISGNQDYHNIVSSVPADFWSVYSARATGTVTQGWNETYINHSTVGTTNTVYWFYDSSNPGTPQFSSTSFTPGTSPAYEYSSSVPHYSNSTTFDIQFNVNRLSGNTYPTSDTFVTGTAGGAFGAPASKTYTQASISTPLAQNLYVSSGSATVNTTSSVISGFGSSTAGPTISVTNSYSTGTNNFTPGNTVLYKTGVTPSTTRIEETNIYVSTPIGTGSTAVQRIINPGSTDTPTFSAGATSFNSQSSTLQSYDATVVANVLKHDQTNYSTGYLPAGPNLSVGRSNTQYFTFKLVRTSVSKFDIKWTGTIAGLWIALPGSTIDTSSTINGWLDASIAYAGAGVPGANTGAGGNGSNGCALGGVAPLNSAQTNKFVTLTLGTESSSSTATNEIYIRIALSSGQTVSALTLQTATY